MCINICNVGLHVYTLLAIHTYIHTYHSNGACIHQHYYSFPLLTFTAEWFWPKVTGSRPPPCAEFSFIKTSDLKVIMTGGYKKNTNLLNGVYQLNLANWVSPSSHLYHTLMFDILELYILMYIYKHILTLQYIMLHMV